jgi:hypothetical protein
MKMLKNKIAAIMIAMFFILSMSASTTLIPKANATIITNLATYAFLNVAPNPTGVGQQVTVDFWLVSPLLDSEQPVNMTIQVTTPSGTTSTLGPFTGDTTGGTYTLYTPAATGNYTFQFFYGGQMLTVPGYTTDYEQPSQSVKQTLLVQSTMVAGVPFTPLPTVYWNTPINAQNVQNWASISGGWMGYYENTFANTGGYNFSGSYNPYTMAPASAHILWTKPWCAGGVAGATIGNSEQGGDYWTTSQYDPKYAPVIMDGIEYSTWYTTQTGSEQGIMAFNLFTGQTMWVINTTNPLRCGMIVNFKNPNQYGDVGPYIFTSSAGFLGMVFGPNNWYMYDGLTGQFLATVTNAQSFILLGQDSNGNIIGYYANATSGTMNVQGKSETFNTVANGPTLEMFNLTAAIEASGQVFMDWSIALGSTFNWQSGLEWAVPENSVINGVAVPLGTGLFTFDQWSGNTLVFQYGATSVGETLGWVVEAGYNANTGALQWIYNRTNSIYLPYTRMTNGLNGAAADGVYVEINQDSYSMIAYSLSTGQQVWTGTLDAPMADGHMPNTYDSYDFETLPDTATGVLYVWALGGDVWAVNMTNGHVIWSWSTVQINGGAGTETPYGIYPLWVFSCDALAGMGSNTILYLSEGHEYDPPLFHGALEVALNATNGSVVWNILNFDDTATAVADGVMTTFNAYDGQIYGYGRGPSATTISAPQIGVTTATPLTIVGSVTDVSPGAKQQAVAANFPNGLPCVSEASMRNFMEAVYEQQPMPTNITGVPVTLTETDHNGNTYTIGTTTTNAYGTYGFNWTPPIVGNYTIVASFAGSPGYYGSCAETYVYANAPPATAAPTASPVTGLASTSTLELGIAVLAIIVIIGIAVLALLMVRKHP